MTARDEWRILLVVPTKLVGPITELVSGEASVVKIEPLLTGKPKSSYKRKAKGISGCDLICQILATEAKTKTAIDAVFRQNGFADKSASAALSGLVVLKQIHKTGYGDSAMYSLAPTAAERQPTRAGVNGARNVGR